MFQRHFLFLNLSSSSCLLSGVSMHGFGENLAWFLEIHAWILGKHGGRGGFDALFGLNDAYPFFDSVLLFFGVLLGVDNQLVAFWGNLGDEAKMRSF